MKTLAERHVELLKGANFGVIATTGEGGRLQTSVVWVDTDGENILVNTTTGRAKGRNLRANPRASITVWDRDDPHRYFEVEGPVSLDDEGAVEHIHELSRRYDGRDFTSPVDRVIARIRPERLRDYGLTG
jgi:PPOX class probable F420-dependent enzyme